jgi:hypothetical protein
MQPMVSLCPRWMHRNLIPETTSLTTSMNSCSSTFVSFRFAFPDNDSQSWPAEGQCTQSEGRSGVKENRASVAANELRQLAVPLRKEPLLDGGEELLSRGLCHSVLSSTLPTSFQMKPTIGSYH